MVDILGLPEGAAMVCFSFAWSEVGRARTWRDSRLENFGGARRRGVEGMGARGYMHERRGVQANRGMRVVVPVILACYSS